MRCQRARGRICPSDRRLYRNKRRTNEDVRSSIIRITTIHGGPNVPNNVCKGIPGDAFRIRRIRTHTLILWGVKKPTIVMTDNKTLTRFFQSKRIPPKLWNYCNQTLQFEFVFAHVPGTENPAADYLSRLDIRPDERIHLKLNDEIPVFHVEIDLASRTPKQDEEDDEYLPDDQHTTTSKQHDAINAILDQVPMCSNEWSRQILERIETIRHQITPIITGQYDEMTFTRFRLRLHDNVVNQVCPMGIFK